VHFQNKKRRLPHFLQDCASGGYTEDVFDVDIDVDIDVELFIFLEYPMATKKSTKKVVKKTVKKAVSKQPEDLVRKIQRQNNGSTTITIPADLMRELSWRDKQKVVVKIRGKGLVVEDWKG